METRDAGGLAPGGLGTELRSCANGRRGERSAPHCREGLRPAPPRRRGSRAGSAPTAHPRGSLGGRAGGRAGGKKGGCRAPPPLPSVSNWAGQKLRGHRGNIPTESEGTVIFRVEALYLPGRTVWLPSDGSSGDQRDDCCYSTGGSANPGSGK